jgi:hypothetical protein
LKPFHTILSSLLLAALVTACPGNSNPGPVPLNAKIPAILQGPNGWTLTLRGGVTSIHTGEYKTTNASGVVKTAQLTNAPERLEQLEAVLRKLAPNVASSFDSRLRSEPASDLGQKTLIAQATRTPVTVTAAGLLLGVAQNGQAPKTALTYSVSGPAGAASTGRRYPANAAWFDDLVVAAKGTGEYKVNVSTADGPLEGRVSIDLADAALEVPSVKDPFQLAATGRALVANWQAVPDAKTYVALLYDTEAKKYLGGVVTSDSRIEISDVGVDLKGFYTLDVIATNLDLLRDPKLPYQPLPDVVRSSVAFFGFAPSSAGGMVEAKPLVLIPPTGQPVSKKLRITGTATFGALAYSAEVQGKGLSVTENAKGVLLGNEARDITVTGSCLESKNVIGSLIIKADVINGLPTFELPVSLECGPPPTIKFERVLALPSSQNFIQTLTLSPDGKTLLTAGYAGWTNRAVPGLLNWYDITSGALLTSTSTEWAASHLDWRADGQQIVTVQVDGNQLAKKVQTFHVPTQTLEKTLDGWGPVAYSPDGSKLAVSVDGGKVQLLNPTSGSIIQTLEVSPETAYLGAGGPIRWNPQGTLLATMTSSGLRVFEIATNKKLLDIYIDSNAGFNILWDPTGARLIVTGPGSYMYNAQTGTEIKGVFSSGQTWVIAWSPDGRYLLAKALDRFVVLNAVSGAVVAVLNDRITESQEYINPVGTWSRTGERFAFIDNKSNVHVYTFK